MIDSRQLLGDLQRLVRRLEADMRLRCEEIPEVDAPLREQYDQAKAKQRTAMTYRAWRDEELTQVAVAWVLACVFIRFLEDNGLIEVPRLSGPGARLRRAKDDHELFFRSNPTLTEREYLEDVFTGVGQLPAMREFFDRKHNPLWLAAPSGDGCRELWQFWQKTDPETGALFHDFTDPEWGTRFLGDLYQDLSEAARKRYALLQTPDFVEEFILDRTLTPAIETFGHSQVRMIDPTCGSGHFLLGGFACMFRIWQQESPGENPRVLAQRALDAIYGVDLNPFAVAIARFRLLLAALRVCNVMRLKDAPDFQIHIAVGDSLLHGARFDHEGKAYLAERQEMFGGDEVFRDELAHFFETEDSAALHRILGQQYHAVVGNPPYITVKDKALNQLYRQRYDSCHRQYSLSVPFLERFFDLALRGSGDGRQPAGFTGQITANSFMKREFGKKLIEEHIPRWDLTHVIDSDKAFIPGHATPTVILFGRNCPPQAPVVRTIMGIRKEIPAPAVPAEGKAWNAILDQVDCPGSESEFVSSADTSREKFHGHPWSLEGGGAAEVKSTIENAGETPIENSITEIGRTTHTGEDDAFVLDAFSAKRQNFGDFVVLFVEGEVIRDSELMLGSASSCIFPYNKDTGERDSNLPITLRHFFWPRRASLRNRRDFGQFIWERGLVWWEHSMFFPRRFLNALGVPFAFVATHNHFVLDRGGKVFNRSAPVIKLPANATEDDHLRLLGLLNSAVACFWMKQVFHDKGAGGIGGGIASEQWEHRYEFDGTKLKQFPVPAGSPLTLARELDHLARELSDHSPGALADRDAVNASSLAEAERAAAALRGRMISLQEELDWQCYRHYGLIDADDDLEWPEGRLDALPPLALGARAFEIRMARQMATGDLETTWFERHKDAGSKPITELPADWPEDYRALVERRLARIEADKNIHLIERPEYKRRWNTEPWAKRQEEALRKWLLTRLEGYFFEGNRVCDLKGSFDPGAHGFAAATGPHLVTTHQLADAVQSDRKFLEAAEVYLGATGFSVPKLVRELVESESVPFLPVHRYKDSGLRKRADWETTWNLQREEDRIDAATAALKAKVDERATAVVDSQHPGLRERLAQKRAELDTADRQFHDKFCPGQPYDPDRPHHAADGFSTEAPRAVAEIRLRERADDVRALELEVDQARQAAVAGDAEILELQRQIAELPQKPDIPVPPKYQGGDFKSGTFWKLRGKLDVPKERWISYPGAERDGDPSPLIAWAGWNHKQQAEALAEYYLDAKNNQGWPAKRLQTLLAGLRDLLPWLKQWHNVFDHDLGMGLGDYFEGFLREECRSLELTEATLDRCRFAEAP